MMIPLVVFLSGSPVPGLTFEVIMANLSKEESSSLGGFETHSGYGEYYCLQSIHSFRGFCVWYLFSILVNRSNNCSANNLVSLLKMLHLYLWYLIKSTLPSEGYYFTIRGPKEQWMVQGTSSSYHFQWQVSQIVRVILQYMSIGFHTI